MTGNATQLILNIDAGKGVNLEELAELTLQLRENLMELDVKAVELVSAGKVPRGAKAGEAVIWGKLLVTLPPLLINKLIDALQSWLSRLGPCNIDLEISGNKLKVTGTPSEEQQQLIKTFIAAVGSDCQRLISVSR